MKLTIVRGGGLGGLVTRTEVRSDVLPPDDARMLIRRVEQAGVVTMREQPASQGRHADELLYAITVEDQGRVRTLRFSEGTLPERVRALIACVDSLPDRDDRIEPPGGRRPADSD
jgi:emfourin